jgi:hypothetical protein
MVFMPNQSSSWRCVQVPPYGNVAGPYLVYQILRYFFKLCHKTYSAKNFRTLFFLANSKQSDAGIA